MLGRPPGLAGFLPYYSDGLALVQNVKDGKTSYIDRNGKIVFTLSQKQPVSFGPEDMERQSFNFSEGMCRIVKKHVMPD